MIDMVTMVRRKVNHCQNPYWGNRQFFIIAIQKEIKVLAMITYILVDKKQTNSNGQMNYLIRLYVEYCLLLVELICQLIFAVYYIGYCCNVLDSISTDYHRMFLYCYCSMCMMDTLHFHFTHEYFCQGAFPSFHSISISGSSPLYLQLCSSL